MSGPAQKMNPVNLVTASAGTGKTTRLTEEIANTVRTDIESRSVLATTFTNKAAAELIERARGRLIDEGLTAAATGLLGAQVGTVNSVFGHLVGRFALEAGRSPVADVIPEERMASVFAAASEPAIAQFAPQMIPIAQRLGIENWEEDLRKICDLVRQNDIDPNTLNDYAERSWNGLAGLLVPPVAESPEALDDALAEALRSSAAAIDAGSDTTKTTKKVRDIIGEALAVIDSGRSLPWSSWARLSKLSPAVASVDAVAPVLELTARHPAHPGLHRDLEQYIRGIFACASDALQHYARFKETNGLVDFVDQEHQALQLLARPDVVDRLHETTRVAFVDEFQDTSPIQLALFLKLAQLVDRSFWVGDPKQAIYGFRGADPELMTEAVRHVVSASGGEPDTLATSYRSRPSLVNFVNAAFVPAFGALGFDEEVVRIDKCARSDGAGQSTPLAFWALSGRNWDDAIAALVEQIRVVLDNADTYPVGKLGTSETRPLRGSDIAILCRQNVRCELVASALANAGLRVSIGRPGLLATPEAVMAIAALHYLVDRNDTLAVAEIAHLTSNDEGQPGWLEQSLAHDGINELKSTLASLVALDEARSKLAYLTPREALEVAIAVAGVSDQAKRWGSAGERIANLDALRGLAEDYEDDCRTSRSAATAGGLVAWLTKVADGGGQPPSTDPEAVNVLTYHKAKGLEWPMVVLVDLERTREPWPFSPTIEKEGDFDILQPLAERWIRFWPWPYDAQRKDVHLDATVAATPEMAEVSRREHAENIRLLYVGTTRARDYLVLAPRITAKGVLTVGWLDALTDPAGERVINVSHALDEGVLRIGDEEFPVNALIASAPDEVAAVAAREIETYKVPEAAEREAYPPLRITPSAQEGDAEPSAIIGKVIDLGDRLPLSGQVDMEDLGHAVHGFLASDRPEQGRERRLVHAREVLERWSVSALQPDALVLASDRLHEHLNSTVAGMRIQTEVPVHGRVGLQRASGRIDLLLTGDTETILIDHKTFPGAYDTWVPKALSYAPQLGLYRALIERATDQPVTSCWVHMPVIGKLIEVCFPEVAGERLVTGSLE